LWDREGVVSTEIDLQAVIRGLYDFDPVGHYSRPDIFSLTVDKRPRSPVHSVEQHLNEPPVSSLEQLG
jgi:nitrilase